MLKFIITTAISIYSFSSISQDLIKNRSKMVNIYATSETYKDYIEVELKSYLESKGNIEVTDDLGYEISIIHLRVTGVDIFSLNINEYLTSYRIYNMISPVSNMSNLEIFLSDDYVKFNNRIDSLYLNDLNKGNIFQYSRNIFTTLITSSNIDDLIKRSGSKIVRVIEEY